MVEQGGTAGELESVGHRLFFATGEWKSYVPHQHFFESRPNEPTFGVGLIAQEATCELPANLHM